MKSNQAGKNGGYQHDANYSRGTPDELAPYFAQHPTRRFQLIELPPDETEVSPNQSAPVLDDKARAALALLDEWIAEGQAADEETRQDARHRRRCATTNKTNSRLRRFQSMSLL